MIKRLPYLLILFLIQACQVDESELYVPNEPPQPPKIMQVVKQELNCSMPFNVRFTAFVNNELGTETYAWQIGGQNYSGKSPLVIVDQTGPLDVLLVVTNEIGSDEYQYQYNYTSSSLPVVPIFNYGAANNNFRSPAKIQFTDLSQRATTVKWDFGDGYQSSLRNPEHTYAVPGTYTITLTAMCDSDTATETALVEIKAEPKIIRFDRFEILEFPKNYFPENADDNTSGGDFYVELYRDNFKYGTSDVYTNRSKTPVYWECPDDWNGDYRLLFYSFDTYRVELWDENDNQDIQLLNAVIDGPYIKNNYYPRSMDFELDKLRFRVYLNYED